MEETQATKTYDLIGFGRVGYTKAGDKYTKVSVQDGPIDPETGRRKIGTKYYCFQNGDDEVVKLNNTVVGEVRRLNGAKGEYMILDLGQDKKPIFLFTNRNPKDANSPDYYAQREAEESEADPS